MTSHTTIPNPRNLVARRGSARVIVLIAIIALVALAAGVLFSTSIRSLIGLDKTMSDGTVTPGSDQLWTCGMHPQVIQDKPGDCPICHMDLTPLRVDNAGGGHAMHASRRALHRRADTSIHCAVSLVAGDRLGGAHGHAACAAEDHP